MYMANVKMLRWGPTATYIPLEMGFALVANANEIYTKKMKCTWPMQEIELASPKAKDTNMLVFLAKVLSFALGDAKVPNAFDFASQWNIGLRL